MLAPDGPAAMARLRDGPLDPRRQVVVESAPDGGLGPFAATPAADATIVAEGTAILDLRADAPGGGFLVLDRPVLPGLAGVRGRRQETPILRADYLFRAVALPPGSHEVRFVFVPWSLQRGMQLSAAGVLIALSAILVGLGGPLMARDRGAGCRRRRRRCGDSVASSAQGRLVLRRPTLRGGDRADRAAAPPDAR